MTTLHGLAIGTPEMREWAERNGLAADNVVAGSLDVGPYPDTRGRHEATYQEFALDDAGHRIISSMTGKLVRGDVKRALVDSLPPTWQSLTAAAAQDA